MDDTMARAESRPAATNILGVNVSAVNMTIATALIRRWIDEGKLTYISPTSVDSVMESYACEDVRRAYNSAALATPDGMPMVWLSRLHGHRTVDRVYGPDLMLELCRQSVSLGYRHFFYGGRPRTTNLLVERLSERFPGIRIAGWLSPPFHSLTDEEDREHVTRINSVRPEIVWVGLGAPKQDLWMASHLGRIHAPVMIGVGAAFDFLSGTKRQAPKFLQRTGFEMLFRVATEPRRLGPRFVRHHPLFVALALSQVIGMKRFPAAADH